MLTYFYVPVKNELISEYICYKQNVLDVKFFLLDTTIWCFDIFIIIIESKISAILVHNWEK